MKTKTKYRILTYSTLLILIALFGWQISYEFQSIFKIDIGYLTIINTIASLNIGIITILILLKVSKLTLYSILHDKIVMTIKVLIYLIITFVFIFWAFFLIIVFLYLLDGNAPNTLILGFIINQIIIALIYSIIVNVFFFSLSIPVKRKEIKSDIQ